MTSRLPSAPKASTSPASQSHIQKRPSCHRGDSPIRIPVAKMSVTPEQTPADADSHRSIAHTSTSSYPALRGMSAGSFDLMSLVGGGYLRQKSRCVTPLGLGTES